MLVACILLPTTSSSKYFLSKVALNDLLGKRAGNFWLETTVSEGFVSAWARTHGETALIVLVKFKSLNLYSNNQLAIPYHLMFAFIQHQKRYGAMQHWVEDNNN